MASGSTEMEPGQGGKSAYAAAGVSRESASEAKDRIGVLAKKTFGPRVLSEFGTFGGIFDNLFPDMDHPVLVASTDGVGTKLKLAADMGDHSTVGLDIAHHCINDILVQGAKPLFFLDYIGMGRMNADLVADIIGGISEACTSSGMALLGGETAELPGLYPPDGYDLVGMILGIVEKSKILDGKACVPGDILLGLHSSGLHTSGYSLARKVFQPKGTSQELMEKLSDGRSVGEVLLTPHRSYLPGLSGCLEKGYIHGLVHITGGGFQENIPRVVRSPLSVEIDVASWQVPEIFLEIQKRGHVRWEEMYQIFNMGMGMIVCVSAEDASKAQASLEECGEKPVVLGKVKASGPPVVLKGIR